MLYHYSYIIIQYYDLNISIQYQYINKDMKHIYNALHIIILFLCRGLYTQYNANLGDGAKHYRISYFWIKNLKIVLETFTMTHFKAIVLYLMK